MSALSKLWFFPQSCENVRGGPWSLWVEELILSNCGVGEDSWESLGQQEIKPVNPKRNQPWIFIERTDAEVRVPILWPPDAKRGLIGKDSDARKDWGQEEKEVTEDEMDIIIDSMDMSWNKLQEMVEGQGSLVCCSLRGRKEADVNERLNNKGFE